MTLPLIQPQPGPQKQFSECSADIALYGGAAGAGKSFSLLMDPIQYMHIPGFGGTIFRRTMQDTKMEGGIWDESMKLYPLAQGVPNLSERYWTFPAKTSLGFAGLQHEKDILNYQGAQICYLGFDELTHFTWKQFQYLMSRNRSTCGIRPYIRATCNPEKNHWLRQFLDWWILPPLYPDGKPNPFAGLPDPTRSGVIRFFIVIEDKIIWGDSKKELRDLYGKDQMPKSFTFISAKLSDNKILMAKDPSYLSNLMAQSSIDRKKLLDGNWDAEAAPGEVFKRGWFPIVAGVPGRVVKSCRVWDRAATKVSPTSPDPDWTRGVRMDLLDSGKILIRDMRSARDSGGNITNLIKNTATQDGHSVTVGLFQDPGSAGKTEVEYMVSQLMGYPTAVLPQTSDKITRAKPMSSQAEFQNILVMAGPWNEDFLSELDSFPSKGHDDIVDAASGAFNLTVGGQSGTFTEDMASSPTREKLQEW